MGTLGGKGLKKKDYDNRSKNGKPAFLVESSKIRMFEPKKNLNISERSNNPENQVRLGSFIYIHVYIYIYI